MVNRIQEILQKYNLTAAKLADKLDVPRSTLSHIFAERNKPSLEFIQKLLSAFPEINARWLVKGEGTIFDDEANLFFAQKGENFTKVAPSEESMPSYHATASINKPSLKAEDGYANIKGIGKLQSVSETAETHEIKDSKASISKQPKNIVKLIAIYSDHTFEEFSPFAE